MAWHPASMVQEQRSFRVGVGVEGCKIVFLDAPYSLVQTLLATTYSITDRRTDDSITPIADGTARSTNVRSAKTVLTYKLKTYLNKKIVKCIMWNVPFYDEEM